MNKLIDNMIIEDDDDEIDVKYIISKKPKPKVVREFLRYNLSCIKDNDYELFENPDIN